MSIVIRIIVLWATLENYSLINRNTNFIDIDDCLKHTCANGGLCVDGVIVIRVIALLVTLENTV